MKAGKWSWDRPRRAESPTPLSEQVSVPSASFDAAVAAWKRSLTTEDKARIARHLQAGGEVHIYILFT